MPLLPHKIILAIGAVVDIALHSGKEPVSARDLADRLQLPGRHLEPVLQTLVRKGILRGVRGRKGGTSWPKLGTPSVFTIYLRPSKRQRSHLGCWAPSWCGPLAQAEQCFGSTLKRITVEDLVRAAQWLASNKAGHQPRPEEGEVHSTPKSY
jgi:Rrf2 family iron-sulfur cluster assembly transcriptional regulator